MGDNTNSWRPPGFVEPSAAYTSASQQARHLAEAWMAEHGPVDRLPPLPTHTFVSGFRCAACVADIPLCER